MANALSDLVQVSTTTAAATPTQQGYGIPLVAAQKCPAGFTNRVRYYSGLAGMVTDGFATSHPAYLAVSEALAQNPAPPIVGVGRRALGATWTVTLTCTDAVQNDVYTVTVVNTATGTATNITRTVPGSSSNNAEATAIAALINAVSGFAASASTNVITITATGGAGVVHQLKNWQINGVIDTRFYLADTTADPGIATDLAAILAENSAWYGLTLDSPGKLEIQAAAAWAETNKKLFVQQSSDSAVPDTGSSDVASNVQTSAYTYTAIIYNGNNTLGYSGLAWQASRFAGSPTPGNDTWAYKTLAGIAADILTETQFAQLGTKSCTGYVSIASVNITAAGGIATNNSGGKCSSGMYIDQRRFTDWLNTNIQTAIYIALLNAPKIPYTDKGLQSLVNVVLGQLEKGVEAGGLVDGSYTATIPLAASQTTADRGNRKANSLNWTAQQAGAVHLAVVAGSVTT